MSHPEPKHLYRRLDQLFQGLDPSQPPRRLLPRFLEELFRRLQDELCLTAGVLFDERPEALERTHVVGTPPGPVPESVPSDLCPVRLLYRNRSYLFPDPGAPDSPARCGLLPSAPAAAFVIGESPARHAFFFLLGAGWMWDKVDFTLNTVRVALSARLFAERARGSFLEAAEIQKSLLVDEPPPFPGYDLACRSVPTEEVGGDFFDFLPFDAEMLGIAVGDASGHGLPAALLVRDVVTGLRMGIEKDLKVGHAFRKLNQVIHRSRLSSRFVSVFYGELEPNGNLIYVNAGHPAPRLLLRDRVAALATGGTVIGPLPDVRFKRGFAHVDRGATLLLYTDGLIERRGPGDEQFGVERLEELVRSHPKDTAAELVERIFSEVQAFGGGRPWEDDATAVVIRREPSPPSGLDPASTPRPGPSPA